MSILTSTQGRAPERGGGGLGVPSLSLARRRRLAVAGGSAALGAIALVAGWVGVSGTRLISDQLSYLASGSVIGLGLLGLGAMVLIADFMLEQEASIRELRMMLVDLLEVGDRAPQHNGNGQAGPASTTEWSLASAPAAGGPDLVGVAGARRVHRPACSLVTAKPNLVSYTVEEAAAAELQPCRICTPELASLGAD